MKWKLYIGKNKSINAILTKLNLQIINVIIIFSIVCIKITVLLMIIVYNIFTISKKKKTLKTSKIISNKKTLGNNITVIYNYIVKHVTFFKLFST